MSKITNPEIYQFFIGLTSNTSLITSTTNVKDSTGKTAIISIISCTLELDGFSWGDCQPQQQGDSCGAKKSLNNDRQLPAKYYRFNIIEKATLHPKGSRR